MFSVTPETTVAATSQTARSKQTSTSQQSSPATDGFAALVDSNASAAADHDPAGNAGSSRGNTEERPRHAVSAETKPRKEPPAKAASAPASDQNPVGQTPTSQDPAATTQVATGIVPGGKKTTVITLGQSNSGTDQASDDQTTTDSQTASTDSTVTPAIPGPVAVAIPTTVPAETPAAQVSGDAPATTTQGATGGSSVIVPENSLAAAAIANGAANPATAPADVTTPATDANSATSTPAATPVDAAAEAAATATAQTDLTAGSPVTAEAAVTVAAAAPAAVAATTKSATTPAAIDMADSAKADGDQSVLTPADATGLASKPGIIANSPAPETKAAGHDRQANAAEAETDAPADEADARKPAESRDIRPATASHDHRGSTAPTLQSDPSLQVASTTTLQQPQVQPTTNAPIPAAQLGVALATNMPVPLNGLAVDIALKAASGKSRFEIRLDPADLGRIDVRLDVDKHGQVTSHLTVEKPSTLDMLRKDAPQLQRALEDAGLKTGDSGLQFSLRDQSQSGQQNDGGSNRNAYRLIISEDDAIPAPVAGKTYSRVLGASSGVDIRI
ncbi:flagellar hook-length control protein FliK [Afipia sp. TerB]